MAAKLFFIILGISVLVTDFPTFESAYTMEGKTEVSMRFSTQEGVHRIVFESQDESFIKNTVVTSTQNQIKVQFPSNLSLTVQGNPDIEASLKGRMYVINLGYPFKTKLLLLTSPPRLSIDIVQVTKEESSQPGGRQSSSLLLIPNIRIVIDPGHGGYDLGILSGELKEKEATLSLARAMESALLKKNRSVFLTRRADQFLSLTERAMFANQKSADIFISIHLTPSQDFAVYSSLTESAPSDTVNEYSIMALQRRVIEKSKALSEGMGKAIKDEFKKDVIYRKMELPLLSSVGTAAIMIEVPVGTISDQAGKARVVDALLKGIALYANQ
ncbi:MAG TPA: N-acetylmuramoyl-L-alanine amidase [Thermodesulfovibrionales bacterium]|nr:N-acetylmuramoyl-L-alanine amidase [Thermodesulfovibrionales bacterium]